MFRASLLFAYYARKLVRTLMGHAKQSVQIIEQKSRNSKNCINVFFFFPRRKKNKIFLLFLLAKYRKNTFVCLTKSTGKFFDD